MKRRRWRRIAMWAGVAATATSALAMIISFGYPSAGFGQVALGGRPYEVSLFQGDAYAVVLYNLHPDPDIKPGFAFWFKMIESRGKGLRPVAVRLADFAEYGLIPTLIRGSTDKITIPLWIPFVLFALPTFFAWRAERRDRRRAAAGACSACGYDLTGNVTGRCPECGSAAEPLRPEGGRT